MTNTESRTPDPVYGRLFLRNVVAFVGLLVPALVLALPGWFLTIMVVFMVLNAYFALINLVNWRGWFR